jgi:hypothetical protein
LWEEGSNNSASCPSGNNAEMENSWDWLATNQQLRYSQLKSSYMWCRLLPTAYACPPEPVSYYNRVHPDWPGGWLTCRLACAAAALCLRKYSDTTLIGARKEHPTDWRKAG